MKKDGLLKLVKTTQLFLNLQRAVIIFFQLSTLFLILLLLSAFILSLVKAVFLLTHPVIWGILFIAFVSACVITIINGFGLSDTACWLDEKLKTKNLLLSALYAGKKEIKNGFDEKVLDEALLYVSSKKHINPFFKKNVKRLLVFSFIFSVMLVLSFLLKFYQPVIKNGIIFNKYSQTRFIKKKVPDKKLVESPEKLSQMLFPESRKDQRKFEKALQNNDFKTLYDMLEPSEKMNKQLADKGKIDDKKEKLLKFRKEFSDFLKAQEEMIASEGEKVEMARDFEEGSMDWKGLDKKIDLDKNQDVHNDMPYEKDGKENGDNNTNSKGSSLNSNKKGNLKGEEGVDPGDEDDAAMEEAGGTDVDARKLQEGSSEDRKDRNIILKKGEDNQLVFLLPDKNVQMPLKEALPELEQGAFNSLLKEQVPPEYNEFVKNYFLQLSQSQ